jgi:hypothetical protein
MSRNRVIPPSEALFASTNATGTQTGQINQIYRVQSANYSASTKRTPVTQYGQQAPIDQVILEPNEVSLDFSYLVTNALNESYLGFSVQTGATQVQAISGFLTKATDERNYYVLTTTEGNDAVGGDGTASSNQVWGIGNGFISNYQFEAAVGSFPTASISVQALNLVAYTNSTGQATPAINPTSGTRIASTTFSLPSTVSGAVGQASALKPGDVYFSLTSPLFGVNLSDAKIQNTRISVDLGREPLNKLGSHFPFSRELQYPINVTISVDAMIGDLTTGSLSDIICNDASYDLSVGIRKPSCDNAGATAILYTVKGAKLDNQNISSSLGSNKSVSLQWTSQIGGPNDTNKGLFISGVLV